MTFLTDIFLYSSDADYRENSKSNNVRPILYVYKGEHSMRPPQWSNNCMKLIKHVSDKWYW